METCTEIRKSEVRFVSVLEFTRPWRQRFFNSFSATFLENPLQLAFLDIL